MDDKEKWTAADECEAARLSALPEPDPEDEIDEALANRTDDELEAEVSDAMAEAEVREAEAGAYRPEEDGEA